MPADNAKVTSRLTVRGAPGTGKTEFLQRQLATYASRDGIEPEDMLAVSLTRTAASVLRGRLPIPADHAATLHSLAFHALGLSTGQIAEKGKLARDWNEQPGLPATWYIDERSLDGDTAPEGAGNALALYSRWRGGLRKSAVLAELAHDFASRWEDYKRETHSYDFCDLLECCLESGTPIPHAAAVFAVDEAQDLDPLSWALADYWGDQAEHYLAAGDGGQVLYAFAGAEPARLTGPVDPATCRVLSQSYRLPQSVHTIAERWLATHSGEMMAGRVYASTMDEGLVEWRQWGPTDGEAIAEAAIADAALGSTMVLTTCKYQLAGIIAALRAAGEPFANAYRPAEAAWNPLGGVSHGVSTADRLRAFLAPSQAWTPAQCGLWTELLKREAFVDNDARARVLEQDGVLTLTEATHLLVPGVVNAAVTGDLAPLAPLLYARFARVWPYLSAVVAAHGREALFEEPSLTVGTVHSTKGGEADHVMLLPHLSPAGERHRLEADSDDSVRLRYVGMTRARQTLTLCVGRPTSWASAPVDGAFLALVDAVC